MLKIVALDSLEVMVFVTFRWEDTLQLRFGFGILHNLTIFFVLFTASIWLQPSIKYQSPRVVVGKAEVNTKTNNHKSGKLANSETTTKTKIYARWNLKLFFSY